MRSTLRSRLRVILPVVVLAAGVGIAIMLAGFAEKPPIADRAAAIPVVEAVTVQPSDVRFSVFTTGTVQPTSASELVAEVSGRVIEVAPALADGAFIEAGQVLVRIERAEFEVAVTEARSRIAETELRVAWEQAEAESARREWQLLREGEAPSALVLREPQLAEARAMLAAAEARLQSAQRDLDRTEIKAPYTGRVLRKSVDLGQYVTRGRTVAEVYSTATAEVALPIHDRELQYLELQVDRRGGEFERAHGPEVLLRADFGGREVTWQGRIVRTGGRLDPTNKTLDLIAEVASPYAVVDGRPPLLIGMFVRGEILGRVFPGVFEIPRAAFRPDGTILVIDAESRLRLRKVEVIRKERARVVARSGVTAGERICITPLDAVTDGTAVRVAEPTPIDGADGTPAAPGNQDSARSDR